MQVKVYVQATFPNQVGSPLYQLAKEQALGPGDKKITGESRSKALEKDIEIANSTTEEGDGDDDEIASKEEGRNIPYGAQQVNENLKQHQEPEAEASNSNLEACQLSSRAEDPRTASGRGQHQVINEVQAQARVPSGILRQSASSQGMPQDNTEHWAGDSSSSNARTDGRYREG